MSNYDAERYDTGEKLFKYRTEIFFNTHTSIANFYHMTALGGYLGTLLRVKWHKFAKSKSGDKNE